ncbi:protein mono-ADP-ribosyltransferase PARP4 [Protobothrops mucrosquamatus]|uniref:protein mono-ADP-ribosyltransferase PARP4 n=1 Tax=Protobothrops mucrosquamatus TaxID=103944 RepID=UPI0007756628|nr:protein mono-ADP-ribosyltransferase PARP4 [Protobothrops mucrosquamatus]
MTIATFARCIFFLRIKKLTILEKNRLKKSIKENGGQIAFGLNQECTHVVADDADALSPSHLKTIQKYELPIVNVDFIWESIKERRLLQCENYELSQSVPCETGTGPTLMNGDDSPKEKDVSEENHKHKWDDSENLEKLRWYSENGEYVPYFPKEFELAKYDILEKIAAHGEYVVLEMQCFQQECNYPFCIRAHYSMLEGHPKQKRLMAAKTSEEARRLYALSIQELKKTGFELRKDFPYQAEYLVSEKLQEMLVADAVSTIVLSEKVGRFVELIWTEAVGHLDGLLDTHVTISLNDVSRAEGILLQAKKSWEETASLTELSAVMSEFYKIIPHKNVSDDDVSKELIYTKRDLCQLIRDMLNISEINMSVLNPSSLSKYRALRCRIDALDVESEEFNNVKHLLEQNSSENLIQVLNIYKVSRATEGMVFEGNLGNVQSLFHGSSVCNFVGILSRGLLLPRVAEDYALQRTDFGYLGNGIYFSNSVRTSIKYSQPCETDGTRLLLICDVALGKCWKTEEHCYFSREGPPFGHGSVHGIRRTEKNETIFEDDEFVVYRTSQVKIKYVVQYSCVNDKIKVFQPIIQTELEDQSLSFEDDDQSKDYTVPSCDLLNDISAGLLDRAGNRIPLKDIQIKGRIIDFIAEVVVFQTYENETESPIEAKYVFPLDDTAAVCGFEAFIKGKHIIGEVKEKEKAHQEYREAISRGDGAYMMDQDAPDIFTVSVGNLPPSTKVLIKITYITELSYENGNLCFHLPTAVAPWQQDKALHENTQDSVRKICIRQTEAKREFSLEMSIEMPFKINNISSWTHPLKIKKTDCKAVVSTTEGSFLDTSGFSMEILIGDVYLPRMWVEKHPDGNSEACMLVFQPEFEVPFDHLSIHGEAVICLDCSNSMAGSAIQQAKEIALHALNSCHLTRKISVFKFGTNFVEVCSNLDDSPMDFTALKEFITSATATMGESNLWKVLRYLSLLYPSKSKRNIILISDGHLQNEGMTLQVVKKNALHTRIFTCGVGPTANCHMLRSLSYYGAGAFEYFDVKSKYNWDKKVKSQTTRMFSPQCSSILIEWQTYSTENPKLSCTPAQIHALFNHERLLVYGFILNCTQAILKAQVDNQKLYTLVSTTELQKTTGTMLHKLAARAFIREYERGMLDENETEHEMKREQLKSDIIELSLKNSIVTQFTSFVAIEKREGDEDQSGDILHHLEPVDKHDVDILPCIQYSIGDPLDNDSMLEHDFISECEISDLCGMGMPAICYYSAGGTLDPDFQVQVSAQEMSVDLCESDRGEIAFGQPRRPPVCKTVSHKKKKPVSKQLLTFQPEGEILKPAKKVKRSASYKRKTKVSETKLKTTHYAAKSSEENLYQLHMNLQDRLPRSFRVLTLSSVDWPQLFKLQNQDGFWQLTSELGMLLDLDVHHLVNVSLAKNGIQSLGPKGKERLLQLIATLLVLQAIHFKQLEGLIFKSLMRLKESPPSWALSPVRKAIEWANRTNREFPGICQRLQLGKDWDDATKKLLGI